MSFIHLHVHSQYSFLDGASSLDKLLSKACELKMPALALTDHNNLTGVIRFYEKAKKAGIKPIIGTEINFNRIFHLTLLCKDKEGYSNLCQLLTEAHLSNRGKTPSISKESLSRLSGGLTLASSLNLIPLSANKETIALSLSVSACSIK